jgi:putative phosphoribosyl transferase
MTDTHPSGSRAEQVVIPPGLAGMIELPPRAGGVILFAHGSGSGRHSPRNRRVAAALHQVGLATLLLDLLTEEEGADRRKVFDIGLLAQRLGAAMHLLASHPATAGLPLGLFGASTGAAAALIAAAAKPAGVGAVVSRGGRPDLADAASLERVAAPTLFIVGGEDREVLALNAQARRRMRCVTELAVLPGAGHLFEEPGMIERVGQIGAAWFQRWLMPERRGGPF